MAALYMTKDEIISSYNRSENKYAQIRILAQLNVCSKNDIIDILTEAGVYTPSKPKNSPKKYKPVSERKIRNGQRTDEEKNRMFRPLYDAGAADYEIAYQCKVSRSMVWNWRNKNHLPPNKCKGNQYGNKKGVDTDATVS